MSGRTKGASVAAGLVRDVRRFDRHEVDLVGGGRVAVAVVVAVAIGLGAGNRGAAASLGAGALLVGITTVVGGPRPSVRLLGTVAVAMGVSTFVGSASGSAGWAHTVLVGVWCLAGGLLMALGSPTSSVGTQAIAAMIVFGRFPEAVGGAAELAGYVVAGGGLAVAGRSSRLGPRQPAPHSPGTGDLRGDARLRRCVRSRPDKVGEGPPPPSARPRLRWSPPSSFLDNAGIALTLEGRCFGSTTLPAIEPVHDPGAVACGTYAAGLGTDVPSCAWAAAGSSRCAERRGAVRRVSHPNVKMGEVQT